jgi:hypothetical protein
MLIGSLPLGQPFGHVFGLPASAAGADQMNSASAALGDPSPGQRTKEMLASAMTEDPAKAANHERPFPRAALS